jgi:spore maturation protein CgeB
VRVVVFGLAVSSSWGNGHATLWRALGRALGRAGGELMFFERNQAFYARTRDSAEFPGIRLVIYRDWDDIRALAREAVRSADLSLVTSYCPDGPDAADLVRADARVSGFYDMDTPVTLASLSDAAPVPYLPRGGLGGFEVVLSYTGGRALGELKQRLGAQRVYPLFGSVDPELYTPAPSVSPHAALSYLGTYAADRQHLVDTLFLTTALRLPELTFLLGGAQYPDDMVLPANVTHLAHVPPPEHPAFYRAAPLTLNVTRAAMAAYGYCPSGRLFEAAACGTAIVSDPWEGIETFFTPGQELFLARSSLDVLDVLSQGEHALATAGRRARERVLDEHTADHRVRDLTRVLSRARGGSAAGATAENVAAGEGDQP